MILSCGQHNTDFKRIQHINCPKGKKPDALAARPVFSSLRKVHALRQSKDVISGYIIELAELDQVIYIIP